jgi:hypothetical protein
MVWLVDVLTKLVISKPSNASAFEALNAWVAYEAVPDNVPVIPFVTVREPVIFTSPLFAILTNQLV